MDMYKELLNQINECICNTGKRDLVIIMGAKAEAILIKELDSQILNVKVDHFETFMGYPVVENVINPYEFCVASKQ